MCMHVSIFGNSFFKQRRILGEWRKLKLLRRVQCIFTMIFFLLELYVHACELNAHKHAYVFLYLAIVFKQHIIWGWCRKFKLLRMVQCMLTMIFALLEPYLHACENTANDCACMFLYLALAFEQCRTLGWWTNCFFSRGSNVYS